MIEVKNSCRKYNQQTPSATLPNFATFFNLANHCHIYLFCQVKQNQNKKNITKVCNLWTFLVNNLCLIKKLQY